RARLPCGRVAPGAARETRPDDQDRGKEAAQAPRGAPLRREARNRAGQPAGPAAWHFELPTSALGSAARSRVGAPGLGKREHTSPAGSRGSTPAQAGSAGSCPARDVAPVIRRPPRWKVKYAQAQLTSTTARLRKPIRKKMWSASQATQAIQPEKRAKPRSATAAERPIVASMPLST